VVTDEKIKLLLDQVESVRSRYDNLHLKLNEGKAFLVGELAFTATRIDETISDSYQIKIEFPQRYPCISPTVKEIGGRITRDVDHHVSPDHTLCLGPPQYILKKFKCDPTALGFIENLVIPKLFWHSYNETHPGEPLPAYEHGDKGIKQYRDETNLKEVYFIILESDNIKVILLLLKMFINGTYKSNPRCPCKSGQCLKDCHGKFLQALLDMPYLKPEHIKCDYDKMFQEAKENGKINDIRPFSTKRKRGQLIKKRSKKRK
jgi:hypothetical protein